tara:strand:+ start:279 stop:548 length:270 start_codon:yes stop_codon:yes gene_type:complete
MTTNQSNEDLEARLEALEKKVKDLKADKDEEIQEIFFEEVLFDKSKYKIGEMKINHLLKLGSGKIHLFKHFQTDAGLVFVLGRWGRKAK